MLDSILDACNTEILENKFDSSRADKQYKSTVSSLEKSKKDIDHIIDVDRTRAYRFDESFYGLQNVKQVRED